MRRAPMLVPVWVAALFCVVPARARTEPVADYLPIAKAHYQTGELDYDAGKFAEAAKEFEEAYRLAARPELLYNMGKSYDGAGDVRGALQAYRRFLAAVPTSTARTVVAQRVHELDRVIARLEIVVSVPGASVAIDGIRIGYAPLTPSPIEVNPGSHTLEIAAEGHATYRATLTLTRGERRKLDARLLSLLEGSAAAKVPVHRRWYLWTALGLVVAAGAVTGGILGVRAANQIDGPSLQLPRVQ